MNNEEDDMVKVKRGKILNAIGIIIGIIWLIVTFIKLMGKLSNVGVFFFEIFIICLIVMFIFRKEISVKRYKQQKIITYPLIEALFGKKAADFIIPDNAIEKYELSLIICYFVVAIGFIIIEIILI